MAKQIKQFRYYGESSPDNQPILPVEEGKHEYDVFVDGSVFDECYPILQLGIQALPGLEFYLNQSLESVVIGPSGIFELGLEDGTQITKLEFALKSMEVINASGAGTYLIVDLIYDDGEV